MKKLYSLIIAAGITSAALNANAQSSDDDFGQLIRSNSADATRLFQAYASPMFKGFGTGLNSGWNNTAKTNKLLHFDLRISVAGAVVPTSQRSFDVTKIGLSKQISVAATSPTNMAPTFGGEKDAPRPVMSINDANGIPTGRTFTMPEGIFRYVPAPNVQLTVGLIKNTDLTIRTTPRVNLGDAGSVVMVGFGIKHNIIQDFAKSVPKPFDLAIAFNWNQLSYRKNLDIRPESGTTAAANSSSDFSKQRIDGTFKGLNVQAILSKKLTVFTPFVAVAYQTANTSLDVLGNFPVTATTTTYTVITDPVRIKETSINGLRADVGFQLNLSVFRVYASVSPGEYFSGNAGIGFGF